MTSPATQPGPPPKSGMSPAELAALLALVQAQARIRKQVTDTAIAGVTALLQTFHGWWDPKSVSLLVSRIVRLVQPAQLQAARSTDAYITRVTKLMAGGTPRPAGAVDITKLRRAMTEDLARDLVDGKLKPAYVVLGDTEHGPIPHAGTDRIRLAVRDDPRPAKFVNPGEPYGRIVEQYRYQVVAEGASEAKAREKALVRIAQVAQTDVTLAVREQYHKNLALHPDQRQKADGWRRILHPELTEHGPCGLCVVAADRIYKIEHLKEIHANCVCEVLPIYGVKDPGISLNWDDLQRIYDEAGSTGGSKRQKGALKRVRVALAENAELGPVLVDAEQRYRGPVEVAKTRVPDRPTRARAQLAALEKTFESLQLRHLQGEAVDKPLRWQADKIAELRRELGITVG